ncbi:hypothetical protein E2542_SST06850 [Spatholobus suberectus]|nr:hypothetical protein E2542_SST06850 [Spatholobus suberectus]
MARNKFLLSLILLALIIFCQGSQSIEGRYLKSDEIIKHHMHRGISTTINVAELVADVSPPTPPTAAGPGRGVDNFRPTAPGHSPGVGHSVHN